MGIFQRNCLPHLSNALKVRGCGWTVLKSDCGKFMICGGQGSKRSCIRKESTPELGQTESFSEKNTVLSQFNILYVVCLSEKLENHSSGTSTQH